MLITTPFWPVCASREVLQAASELELILTAVVGSDHVDLEAAAERGITVAEQTASNVVSVAEHAVMQLLALVRNYLPAHRTCRSSGHGDQVMDPMPGLEDLVRLFEGEPAHSFGVDDAPWPYVCVRFAVTRGPARVELEVEPASELVTLSAAGEELVDLELPSVRSLVVERRAGKELLGIVFDERLLLAGLWSQTKPVVSLTGSVGTREQVRARARRRPPSESSVPVRTTTA